MIIFIVAQMPPFLIKKDPPPAPLGKQGCFILPEKWQGEQREQRKLQGAEGDFSE